MKKTRITQGYWQRVSDLVIVIYDRSKLYELYICRFHYALIKLGCPRTWYCEEFCFLLCRTPISQGCTRKTLGGIPSASLVIGKVCLSFFSLDFSKVHFLHRPRVLILRFFLSNPGRSGATVDL